MGLNEATCRKLYARRQYKCTYWAIVVELRPMLIERGGLGSAYTPNAVPLWFIPNLCGGKILRWTIGTMQGRFEC